MLPVVASLLVGVFCASIVLVAPVSLYAVTPFPESTAGSLGNGLYFVVLAAVGASLLYLLLRRRNLKLVTSDHGLRHHSRSLPAFLGVSLRCIIDLRRSLHRCAGFSPSSAHHCVSRPGSLSSTWQRLQLGNIAARRSSRRLPRNFNSHSELQF